MDAFAMSNISGLRSLVASAPDDWNVLKLHTVNFRLQTKICNETTQAFVPFSWLRSANETAAKHWGQWGHWGTAAYVINRAGMEKALHATGYPNHAWGRRRPQRQHSRQFIISPAVAGEVYSFARPLLSLMSVESGSCTTTAKNTRGRTKHSISTHVICSTNTCTSNRCQPLNRTGSRLCRVEARTEQNTRKSSPVTPSNLYGCLYGHSHARIDTANEV